LLLLLLLPPLLILASPRGLQLVLVLQFALYSYLQIYELLLQHPVRPGRLLSAAVRPAGAISKSAWGVESGLSGFFLGGKHSPHARTGLLVLIRFPPQEGDQKLARVASVPDQGQTPREKPPRTRDIGHAPLQVVHGRGGHGPQCSPRAPG